MAKFRLLFFLFCLTLIGITSCDSIQKRVASSDTTDIVDDSVKSLMVDNTEGRNKKNKVEIIEEKIGPGWEELGRVKASCAVLVDGELKLLELNGLSLYLYAKIIGNDIIYQATTKKIEDWGDVENDLELVIKGDFVAYYLGEAYHFNATALKGWYFNLP